MDSSADALGGRRFLTGAVRFASRGHFAAGGRSVWRAVVFGLSVAVAPAAAGAAEVRQIEVPGSALTARIWSDVTADGTTMPFYAVAFDGTRYSEPRATSYALLIGGFEFTPGADGSHGGSVPAHLAAGADTNLHIVQYYTQPLDAYRDHLTALGAKVHKYLPHNAEVIEMTPAVRDQVAAQPYVRWVGFFHPAYRLTPGLREQVAQPFADFGMQRYSIEAIERGPAAQGAIQAHIEALGGTVHYTNPAGFRMEASFVPGMLLELARLDQVNHIAPWPGQFGLDMDIARGPAGHDADYVETVGNFRGQGVRGEVLDVGVRPTHVDFQNTAPLYHTRNGSSYMHGTSCYGQVFGTGAGNPFARGMCPAREQGIFADFTQLNQPNFGGQKSRYDHTRELVDPNGPYRAVFQSSSVGSVQVTSYDQTSAEVDDYLFLYDLLSCQSQSNTATRGSRPQAWAKNVVSIGGFNHYNNTDRADDRWGGASFGPADDERVKPDLAAYYDNVLTTYYNGDTAYTSTFNGTSSATPMTCGVFGLLFQMWHEGVWAGHGRQATVFDSRPHMATAKALMINTSYRYKCSADDPGAPNTPAYTNLDRYRQGWGMANVRHLYDDAPWTFVVDETDLVLPLGKRIYYTRLPADRPHLKVTLVYTDLKGDPGIPWQHRVNDLSLRVTTPGPVQFWGNHGLVDPVAPHQDARSWSAAGGEADTQNTVENVFLPAPAAGVYKTEVLGSEIVKDSHVETPNVTDADFALVVNGGHTYRLGDADCNGRLTFGDINPFVLALAGETAYYDQYPDCIWHLADVNDDGSVNFTDINPFVELLTQAGR